MAIKRLEVSNPKYTPENTQLLTIHSSYLNRRHDVSIYNVNAQGNDVPIIVLLHGVYGNHWVWMHLGGVHQVYESIKASQGLSEFILVMPSDGGIFDGSGYLPTSAHDNYDGWIVDDVINAVIETVPNASNKSHLYITGLSMGGYGALRLGAKYASRFKGISGHSSITKVEDLTSFVNEPVSMYECENDEESSILHWMELNREQLPPVRFDCGKNDILIESNREFEMSLRENAFSYQYSEFEGEHSWEYWHEHIQQTFEFFDEIEVRLKK